MDGDQEQSAWLYRTECPELRVSEQGVTTAGVGVEDDEGAAQDQLRVAGPAATVQNSERRQVRLRKPHTRYLGDVYNDNFVFKEAVLDPRTRGRLLIENDNCKELTITSMSVTDQQEPINRRLVGNTLKPDLEPPDVAMVTRGSRESGQC